MSNLKTLNNRYRQLSLIDSGGMASVYLAFDEKLERQVALKVLHKHLLSDTNGNDFEARFIKEAKSAAKLISQNIVSVYDQGSDGDDIYLVMEYIKGKTLRKILKDNGPLEPEQAIQITQEVLKGLSVAHEKGIVHRDIKPENVMVTEDGAVKLTDFGLARLITDSKSTMTGTVLGTAAYMSPELVGQGVCDTAADIYSVGILLFEMILGYPPFSEGSALQTALAHVKNSVPKLIDIDNSLPQPLSGLVEVFTIREVENRPPDAKTALKLLGVAKNALGFTKLVDLALLGYNPNVTEVIEVDFGETKKFSSPIDFSRLKGYKYRHKKKGLSIPKASSRFYAIFITFILAVSLIGAYLLWENVGPGAYKQIPLNLIGKTFDEASAELLTLDINVEQTEDYSDQIESGKIMAVFPEEGSDVKYRDESVTLTISKGIHYINFPKDAKGKKTAEFAEALEKLGFINVTIEDDYNVDIKAEFLIKTTIKDGAKIRWDEKITLVNSKGPRPIKYPNVVGKTKSEAETILSTYRFKVKQETKYSETIKKDIVISQTPEEGKEGFEGESITIVISLGPPITSVPNVVGLTPDEAHAALKKANLNYQDVGTPILNLVQQQSSKAGSKIAIGSKITLTLV